MVGNFLRQLIESGAVSQDDIAKIPTNQLRMMLNGANDAGGFVRSEDTGHTTLLNGQPGGMGDTPQELLQPPQQQPQAAYGNMAGAPQGMTPPPMPQAQPQQQMRVVGYGNGTVTDMKPEAAAPVKLDYSRGMAEIPGLGKGYYTADGRSAIINNADGSKTKVILGYDPQASMALTSAALAQGKTRAEIGQTEASTALSQEHLRASQVNNPDYLGAGGSQAVQNGVTGDDFLKTLDPQTANEVKALASGDIPFNPRSQKQMQLLGLVTQYDPTFSASDYNARNATKLDFSPKGKSGQVVQAINQALHHAENMSGQIDALNNTNIAPGIVNPVVNWLDQKVGGDTRQGTFMTTANALSEELKKIYAGGGGSLTELQNWQKSFDPNAGQNQQRAYLKDGMQLLQGAIESRKQAYERGMGPKANFGSLIDPSAQSALDKIVGGGAQQPSSEAPQIGEVRKGYRFLGGNPADSTRWLKAG